MSILWKKIEFYKGQTDCEAIVIAAWGLDQSPGGLSEGKVQKPFWLFNVFKAIKRLTMALKNYIHGLRCYTSS